MVTQTGRISEERRLAPRQGDTAAERECLNRNGNSRNERGTRLASSRRGHGGDVPASRASSLPPGETDLVNMNYNRPVRGRSDAIERVSRLDKTPASPCDADDKIRRVGRASM